MTKVSISVAIYNVSKYVEKCVRSLYEQTLDDIEILLVDDCTPDDSMEIAMQVLEEYPHRKDQVHVIHHERNMGIAATKKDGYLYAVGEYVVVVDGDDYLDRRYAELMYNKGVEENADIVVCAFYDQYVSGQVLYSVGVPSKKKFDDNIRKDIINRVMTPCLWHKIIRKSIVHNPGILWPQGGLGEDTVLCPMFAYYAKHVTYVSEPLYYYVVHPSSVSRIETKTAEQIDSLYASFKNNVDILIRFFEKEQVSDTYQLGIFINKLRAKNRVRYQIGKRKYRKLWFDTYPEINKVLLCGSPYYKPSMRSYLWLLALTLGLPANKKLYKYVLKCVPSCKGVI